MSIKNIIFDYGGVLGSDAHLFATNFKKIPLFSGLSPEKILELWKLHWPNAKISQDPNSLNPFWEDIVKAATKPTTTKELEEAYKEGITINDELLEIALSLKPNYNLYILANETELGITTKIEKFNLNKVFLKIFSSSSLQIAKPKEDCYKKVLQEINAIPQETLFVDNLERNIKAAKALDIQTILFKNPSLLKEELNTLLQLNL